MNERYEKRPLILFSGGFDSTYLLLKALRDGDCDVLSVATSEDYNNGAILPEHKVIQEEIAREKILATVKAMRATENIGGVLREYKMNVPLIPPPEVKYSHPAAWIYAALSAVDPKLHSSVQVGYVLGDQITRHLDDIKRAWDSLMAFTKHGYVPLEFPLEYIRKKEIYRSLPKELFSAAWVCELPRRYNGELIRCGKCESCNTHEATITAINKYGHKPEHILASISHHDIETSLRVAHLSTSAPRYEIEAKLRDDATTTEDTAITAWLEKLSF